MHMSSKHEVAEPWSDPLLLANPPEALEGEDASSYHLRLEVEFRREIPGYRKCSVPVGPGFEFRLPLSLSKDRWECQEEEDFYPPPSR